MGIQKNCNITKRTNEDSMKSYDDEVIKDLYVDPLKVLGETNIVVANSQVTDTSIGSDIQEFLRDKNVLITGSTGFMGKVLIEKLLRSVPNLSRLYLLIRTKKDKDPRIRLNELFEDRLYKRLKAECPNYMSKVSLVVGDCSLPRMGMGVNDYNHLTSKINVIFHVAATVRFDETLKKASDINVFGTMEMIAFAKACADIKSVVHVSTAYANCSKLFIEEKFYPTPIAFNDFLHLINTTDDEDIIETTPQILSGWPNTYTFTKAVAEQAVKEQGVGLPIAVFRPAIVVSTYKEPVRGWIDNVYGPTGLIIGAGLGVIHTFLGDANDVMEIVPVDLAVNGVIAAAYRASKTGPIVNDDEIPIYNYVSSVQKPLLWKQFIELNKIYGIHTPALNAFWYYSFNNVKSPFVYALLHLLLHVIPGHIIDFIARVAGYKPVLSNIYRRLGKFSKTMRYFSENTWTFTNDNTQSLWNSLSAEDRKLFFFDISQLDWRYYSQACCLGIRVYYMKDDVDTLPAARKKWKKLYYAHVCLKIITALIFASIISSILLCLFN